MPRNAPVKSEPNSSSRAIIGKKGECSIRKKEKEENFILISPSLAAGGFEKAFQTFLWRTFLITNHHHLHPLSCLKTADVFKLLTINNNKAPTVQRRVGLGASCWHLVTLLLTKKYRHVQHSAVHTKYYTVTTYALLYWTTICLWRICWWSIALPLRMHWAPPGYKGFPKVSAAKQQFLPSTAATTK